VHPVVQIRLVGCLVGVLVDCLVGCLVGCLIVLYTGSLLDVHDK
jgi:hypothetical protein